MNLKCSKCGNDKKFHKDVSVQAKLKVNNRGENLKTIFDIEKANIDSYYEIIYCTICGEVVFVE